VGKEPDWASVGGRASTANEVLGRVFTSELEMTVWDPPHESATWRGNRAPHAGQPSSLRAVPGGTLMRGTTEGARRVGLPGLIDRARWSGLQRVYAEAMARLPVAAMTSYQSGHHDSEPE
jgi:hypothetical protein